jgi:hypothetical protein
MWNQLREMACRFWRRCHAGAEERRVTRMRTHFWAEVRAGEREAEARARPVAGADPPRSAGKPRPELAKIQA